MAVYIYHALSIYGCRQYHCQQDCSYLQDVIAKHNITFLLFQGAKVHIFFYICITQISKLYTIFTDCD